MDSEFPTDTEVMQLCDRVRQAASDLHQYLRNGHLERVYEIGLASRLRKQGLIVEQQYPLNVHDADGALLGEYFPDLYVERILIIELKTAKFLANEHVNQVIAYLRACHRRHALLINFGSHSLQIRKIVF
jgi:GxxExxY protein